MTTITTTEDIGIASAEDATVTQGRFYLCPSCGEAYDPAQMHVCRKENSYPVTWDEEEYHA